MKTTLFLCTLVLVVPAFVAGQTPSREQKPNDPETSRTGSTAVRDRVVGSNRANHVETLKGTSPSNSNPAVIPSSAVTQQSSEPRWGNAAVISRPGQNERAAATPAEKQKTASLGNQPVKKLVQQTALVSEAPRTSPVPNNSTAARTLSARPPAPTVVYQVGVGDVLDIRLSNLPTRESTLFTVLRSGVLEYPLLNGPVSVAGMTTDEIARLLGNEIKVIKTARVSVSVRDYASHAVVVTGLVDSPGKKVMRREAMPLFAVLAEALPRPEASFATIIRDGKSQTVSLSNEPAMATLVLPGDVIKISGGNISTTRFVYVGGEVASRGEKQFRDGMTLTQAILSAGGVSTGTRMSVKVARRNANGFLSTSEYSLQSIKDGKSQDPLLEAGDRIEVTRGL